MVKYYMEILVSAACLSADISWPPQLYRLDVQQSTDKAEYPG